MEMNGGVGDRSLEWTSKYGSMVVSVYGAVSSDGMNERGLTMNLLYLNEAEH